MPKSKIHFLGWTGLVMSISCAAVGIWNVCGGEYPGVIKVITIGVLLLPLAAIGLFSCWMIRKNVSVDSLRAAHKSQLLAIKSVFSLTVGVAAYLALFQEESHMDDLVIGLLTLCAVFSALFFYSSHIHHLLEENNNLLS